MEDAPINTATYICFDFETGSVDPSTTIPLSLSAMAYDARNLEPIAGATFDSLMRPKAEEWDKIEDGALKVNGITREELKTAPERAAVWEQFVSFTNRFRKSKRFYDAPIPCGQNIKNFDLIIINRLCREYGQVDKDGNQNIFSRLHTVDLKDLLFFWYENSNELPNYKFDTVREKFGLSKEGAHSSKVDVEQTGLMIMRFLKLHRKLFGRVPGLRGVTAATA